LLVPPILQMYKQSFAVVQVPTFIQKPITLKK
jgi:hypothetical protein